MYRREALALTGLAVALRLGAAPSARDQLVGLWQLVGQFNIGKNGEHITVSDKQRGRISWDRSGHVWVLLYNDGRTAPASPLMPTLAEYREINSGLMTYYGTYEIDEAKQTVTHHLQAAANPSLIGTDLVRRYEFTGNRVALIFPGEAQRHVVFERIGDL
jgi:hypothetical protein